MKLLAPGDDEYSVEPKHNSLRIDSIYQSCPFVSNVDLPVFNDDGELYFQLESYVSPRSVSVQVTDAPSLHIILSAFISPSLIFRTSMSSFSSTEGKRNPTEYSGMSKKIDMTTLTFG